SARPGTRALAERRTNHHPSTGVVPQAAATREKPADYHKRVGGGARGGTVGGRAVDLAMARNSSGRSRTGSSVEGRQRDGSISGVTGRARRPGYADRADWPAEVVSLAELEGEGLGVG